MENVNLNEYRAEKNGEVTVKALLTDTLERADEFEQVVIITLGKDGYVNHGTTVSDSSLKLLGLVEAGKNQILNDYIV